MPIRRRILRFIIKWMFKLLTRVEVSGLENVPAEGGLILAVNHFSRIDPPLLYVVMKRTDFTGLAADKYKNYPFIRFIVETVGGIWINREDADIRALREALDYLKGGGILGIAPEGTRSKTNGLLHAKTGVAYLADKAKTPVLPVAIYGTSDAMRKLSRLQRPRLYVRFGKLLQLPAIERHDRENGLRKNTDEIMCHIAAMLPEMYRGEYSDYPRLKELLTANQSG
jgi:1-acyl-sn-glycerol-3-phosphate acyltransferase